MRAPSRVRSFIGAAIVLILSGPLALADTAGLIWQPWSADIFTRAKAENKLVILDLEAVWCHWCHVMEETTYRDPKVVALLKSKYITVRADQDANPDLSSRYGDWGWPATIVFAADGTELVKRRGYIEPEGMASLLAAIIEDPTPGPSVGEDVVVKPATSAFLKDAQRQDLVQRSAESFDAENAGWGDVHKFIDADSMDWDLVLAEGGDAAAAQRARRTFDAALNLIDRQDGGIFQYSDQMDWKSPHYEKIMSFQANALRQYAFAYSLWKDPKHLDAAKDIARYLLTVLKSGDGPFYTSQDADVDAKLPGKTYYAMLSADRAALGRAPRVDRAHYARENGWAISGLVAFYSATGDQAALDAAVKAARWIIANRSLDGGGFKHADTDRGGPFLGDTLAMGQAALDLYAATGGREWLDVAKQAGDFAGRTFKDADGGFLTAATTEASVGVFAKAAKPLEEQTSATRFFSRLHRYLGSASYRALAEHGMAYLASDALLDLPRALPGPLLADRELGGEPTHMTIVGAKDDPRSKALHAAARAYPALNKRLDWWDSREGPLPNPDVTYPELPEPAAFACTDHICSLPVFEAAELAATVTKMRAVAK